MKLENAIGWAATALIWLIFFLGASAAWQGEDLLLKANAVLALPVCLWLLRVMTAGKYAPWRGAMQFASFWMVFALFKSIRQVWIHRVFDAELLAIDRRLWGGASLPEHCLPLESYWLSEWVSFGYIQFYLVMLLPVVWFAWKRRSSEARCFFLGLTLMYCFGFAGYLLIPAGGPFIAFPSVFPYPPAGGPITGFLAGMVAQGVTGMDVFPSLHCGATLYVLGFFALGSLDPEKRAYLPVAVVLTLVFIPLLLATVYMRYHYGVDLLAGAALAVSVLAYVQKKRFERS
ncbi:MAG: phosphatase PAP2 family protein [Candidatus Accumulibacter sp.]|nr:phosphatase PAP2 family protein [Accumulibacter sp.]